VPSPLPIDPFLPAIAAAVQAHGAAVVVAPPGAGKTTRVPPFLARDRRVIVLQPRRVAARALARRIAVEQGWTLGDEIGWHVRLDRRFTAKTRVLVATEGILTARLQADPLLSDFDAVVLDEFHERSLHADLALALARQAARARPGLAVIVMSATLDARPVQAFLGDCPLIEAPGRAHPVDVAYAPATTLVDAAADRIRTAVGHVLCFLPGMAEIRRAERDLVGRVAGARAYILHGSLDADAQDEVLRPSTDRKIILATNVAETSLTVEGVTDVVDSGLHKVVRYDPERAFDRLQTERIPQDAADQRVGRAGRTGPGRALRLWDVRDRLRPHREAEIARVDLARPLLEVLAWGGDPRAFEWFEAPPVERVEAALELLVRLGAVRGDRLTPLGETLRGLPLHPRLGALLLAAGGTPRAAAACARMAEGEGLTAPAPATSSDLLVLADGIAGSPGAQRAAEELRTQVRRLSCPVPADEEEAFRRAVLLAFPERVAERRAADSPRLLLASGQGAVLARESGVHDGRYLVAVELTAAAKGEPLVRLASRIEKEWLIPTHEDVEHRVEGRTVRAYTRAWYGRLLLVERPAVVDPAAAAELRLARLREEGMGEAADLLLRRARFGGVDVDIEDWMRRIAEADTGRGEIDAFDLLPYATRQEIARQAPERLELPSGRQAAIEYGEDGTPSVSAKLQELFGLGETPRLGPRREPVLLLLLAPNGRPVQTTRDLRSFWERTYPEVRRELRGRYPRHPWPEDPWTAPPTARAKRRGT
jgi:ATP-dependent helicase HrpB